MMVAPTSAQRVAEAARAAGLEIDVREFPGGTRTAEDAARAIGVGVGQIVKSLVFMTDGHPVLCLVSRPNPVDGARPPPPTARARGGPAAPPRASSPPEPQALVKACRATVADLKEEA